ncbi:unnamed protein product [Brachionus calyciflorus]|uniref:FAD-binding domain-containing protein n=1 Tax=Brachionus calyciflorus TaxID=104777 RepID=A0A814DR85_9BILA|nr:unnamed protein product [Brachionus calyciflorus]
MNDLILISGGGPAGYGASLAFNNVGCKNILVLEGRPDMNFDLENSYPVGLNVRGQNSIKYLLGKSELTHDLEKIGLRVDDWKITVGPGINVANFESGLVMGTSRAEVTQILYRETQRRNGEIRVLFGHKVKSVDLNRKEVTCETKDGEIKVFNPKFLIAADGYRSVTRDCLAQQDSSLKVQQWPWLLKFRVLLSEFEPKTELNPYTHYIQNQVYTSKFLNGRWSASISIKEDSPEFLRSTDPSDKNVDDLKKYLKKLAPKSLDLFKDDELRKFFTRSIFSGSVTKVSKLIVGNWAVLLGDAAHSAYPATGEGINSACEDCMVLQKSFEKSSNLEEGLEIFNRDRIEDANALSDMAYALTRPTFKGGLQMIMLGIFKRFIGPSKEDLLFGKESSVTKRYSEIVEYWKRQTNWLGGPNLPKA